TLLLCSDGLSGMIPDGTIVSKPMEDLYPFLDREEFLENMVVEPVEILNKKP
ncbi:MAG: hypothetical protein HQL53_05060, partial [Magnetococcales bacterium]|nr:hypothetical protein [Magnetococcales bacterium]